MAKVIFHIDLNAFFASAELLRNSGLEGQPIVVGGRGKRGVVCTASYEARAYGVHAAMPMHEAIKKCSNLVILDCDLPYYKEVSQKFFKFLKKFSPLLEIASIDEGYLDVTEVIKQYKRPLDLAWEIQSQLLKTMNLKCSIGIGPTKFLAKMASDLQKPLGIVVMRRADMPKKLWPLPIGDMIGIGKRNVKLLEEKGIHTIKDFINPKNEIIVRQILKKQAFSLIQAAKGNSSDQVQFSRTIQSVSQSNTYPSNLIEYQEICEKFKELAISLAKRCRSKHIVGSLISISIRYDDFTNVVRSHQLPEETNDYKVFYEHALQLFDENYNGKPIRHLGITLGSLKSKQHKFKQLDIFNTHKNELNILTELNKEISNDNNKLFFASELLNRK